VILGIDPGLERTGYAVIAGRRPPLRLVEAGLIRLDPRHSLSERLAELADALQHLIETRTPHTMVCEAIYAHYKHPRTAILMAHARGVILAIARKAGLELVTVSATQAKKALTGNGRASKIQVQRGVATAFRLKGVLEPHDVADAAAIALCGAHVLVSKSRPAVRPLARVAP
jgi:crossover junction endodeoxyribonuclease RuvC